MDMLALMTMIYFGSLYISWVLLPLIPAILIYWLFPNTAVAVDGPFANLTVKASGAFAAYLIVFAATYPLVQTARDTIGGFQRQFWTVRAQIKLVNSDGKETRSDELVQNLRVRPPVYHVDSYHATLKVLEEEGQLPHMITIEIPGFDNKPIILKSARAAATVDHYKKVIELNEPILINQKPNLGANRATSVSQADSRASTESDGQGR
jgi:hypothetical protein